MTKEDQEENENLDAPGEYPSKGDFSKAEIVRSQCGKVNETRSKEMREGYFNHDKLGNKIYVPDTRKEFISAVMRLRNLLSPEIARDSKFQEQEKKLMEEINGAVEKFGIYEQEVIGNRVISNENKPKYIPIIGEVIPVETKMFNKGLCKRKKIDYRSGVFDKSHHAYWNFLVEKYDELDGYLSDLIDRCNYFKEGINF